MARSHRLGLVTWGYQVRIPIGTDICHSGCAYTVLQTVQRPEVYSTVYGTVHHKEPLKSFEIRVGYSPGFGLPSVAILPWLCRKRRKAIFIHCSQCTPSQHCLNVWLILAITLPENTKHLYNIYTTSLPTLYKCYTYVSCLLGCLHW